MPTLKQTIQEHMEQILVIMNLSESLSVKNDVFEMADFYKNDLMQVLCQADYWINGDEETELMIYALGLYETIRGLMYSAGIVIFEPREAASAELLLNLSATISIIGNMKYLDDGSDDNIEIIKPIYPVLDVQMRHLRSELPDTKLNLELASKGYDKLLGGYVTEDVYKKTFDVLDYLSGLTDAAPMYAILPPHNKYFGSPI